MSNPEMRDHSRALLQRERCRTESVSHLTNPECSNYRSSTYMSLVNKALTQLDCKTLDYQARGSGWRGGGEAVVLYSILGTVAALQAGSGGLLRCSLQFQRPRWFIWRALGAGEAMIW